MTLSSWFRYQVVSGPAAQRILALVFYHFTGTSTASKMRDPVGASVTVPQFGRLKC